MTALPPIKYLVGELVAWLRIADADDPAAAGARMADLYRLAIENYDYPAYAGLIEALDERDVVDAEISDLTPDEEHAWHIAVGRTFLETRSPGSTPLDCEKTLAAIGAASIYANLAHPHP